MKDGGTDADENEEGDGKEDNGMHGDCFNTFNE